LKIWRAEEEEEEEERHKGSLKKMFSNKPVVAVMSRRLFVCGCRAGVELGLGPSEVGGLPGRVVVVGLLGRRWVVGTMTRVAAAGGAGVGHVAEKDAVFGRPGKNDNFFKSFLSDQNWFGRFYL
jgi:hypothetical protein